MGRAKGDDRIAILYRGMRRVRHFEELASVLYRDGEIPGFCHLSIGQESVPVGVCAALRPTDAITSTHRGHGHTLAKGANPAAMFAELMGLPGGLCDGLGGSMHVTDPAIGMYGANGVVGAGIPIAVGAGLACSLSGEGDVAVSFFGDGAVATGAFHEAVNLAALWKLPVLFVCENNGYAEFTRWDRQHPVAPHERACAYGIEAHRADGHDVTAVVRAAEDLVSRLRSGEGPFLLEVAVERWHGHYEGDPVAYRDEGELEAARARDPLTGAAVEPSERERIDREVEEEMARAVEDARASNGAYPNELSAYVVAPRSPIEEGEPDENGDPWRYADGVRNALADAMAADERVLLSGVDVGAAGGIFRVTQGLYERFGADRVRDTPISETAIIGLAIGAAMRGLRPVVEIMFIDFIGVCFDQLLNQAAKLRFMSGGNVELPLVVRTQYGAGRAAGAQHSQSLEGILAAIPGLSVVIPSTSADAYGLLRSAIDDPNPVIFIEHRRLYGRKSAAPAPDHRVPIGRARCVRRGTDLTFVATGALVHEGVEAAEVLSREHGLEVEVIDLRSIVPLDVASVAESVEKTSRLAVAHEAPGPYGPGSELITAVQEVAYWAFDAPPVRIAPPAVPAPYAPALEREWLPGRDRIVHELLELAKV